MPAKPIVAATDGSEESLRAVEWAAREAALHDAPLRIVSAAALLPRMVEKHTGPDLETVTDEIVEGRDRALSLAAERAAKTAADVLIDTDHLTGAPAEAVTEAGSGAMMLVVGSRGVGAFAALLLGSISRYAATHAPCPVVVVRDETTAERRQVAVGVGDPDSCPDSLSFAFEEAAARHASLHAVYAWDVPRWPTARALQELATPGAPALEAEIARQLTALMFDWQNRYPDVPVTSEVVRSHPARVLAGLSARADLVVLGRHSASHHGDHHGPGAVTHAVLDHAHGPVATVPSVS